MCLIVRDSRFQLFDRFLELEFKNRSAFFVNVFRIVYVSRVIKVTM